MNKKKIIVIVLLLFFISPLIYENYLYYKIPYNPFSEYSTDLIVASYTKYTPNMADRIGDSDSDVFYSNDNLEIGPEILKYLKNLKLKPMKTENIDFDKIDYSYSFQLSSPQYDSIIVFVSSEDLSKIYISTQML